MTKPGIQTLSALKKSGYQSQSIKDELRNNLVKSIQDGVNIFEGIYGFDDTVIPDLERAILSRHNILLLGLRGQAKTKIARMLIRLLDEYIPIVAGSELNDDPLEPTSKYAVNLIAELGDDTPIEWLHRSERYVEKLATPDVTVADLIGDVDPIKAASLKLTYNDERVIHYGLIPRSNRCLFVINELPDLQARIQVSLFNILQEGDIQIRGFKIRLNLDIEFLFTANPEDYTNRGSIITPLKDRIDSQILTHYPDTIEIARKITDQEAHLTQEQKENIYMPDELKQLIEMIVFEARDSELVDEKSGVSARLSISAYENLISTAERRMLKNKEKKTQVRITDLWGIIPSITGKVELVYEGEQEGPYNVALLFINNAIKELFLEYFPDPEKQRKAAQKDPYATIRAWFSSGNIVELLTDETNEEFTKKINTVSGIQKILKENGVADKNELFWSELVLHALAECNMITKEYIDKQFTFKDQLAGIFNDFNEN
jgi:magnesium chelatase subunit I